MKHIILIILLTLGTWAQEVGVPYVQLPKDVKELNIGLSRDGKTFYTYENNTLIHWNMNPVQIIDSVKITDPMFPSPLNFDLLPDGKRIVFSNPKHGIGLFDLLTKKFIKKIPMQFRFDTAIGLNLVTVDKNRTITVRDLGGLNVIKHQDIPTVVLDCDECSDDVWGLLKNYDESIFILLTDVRVLVFNAKTMNVVKEIKGNFHQRGPTCIISNFNYEVIIGTDTYLNLSTLESGRILHQTDIEKEQKETLTTGYSLVWHFKKWSKLYLNSSTNVLAKFSFGKLLQFDASNWIIMNANGYFDGSPESRKYLYIKSPSGASVAIDDATYNKFHKLINLKD